MHSKNSELLKTTAFVAIGYKKLDLTVDKPKSKADMLFEAKMDDGNLSGGKSDYYIMEELQQLEDPTMANLAGILIIFDSEELQVWVYFKKQQQGIEIKFIFRV